MEEKEMSLKTVQERFIHILKESNLSQTEFAKALDLSPAFISNICNGKARPSKTTATLIEIRYGYFANWVLEGKGPIRKPTGNSSTMYEIAKLLSLMDEDELFATKAFIYSLNQYKLRLDEKQKLDTKNESTEQ